MGGDVFFYLSKTIGYLLIPSNVFFMFLGIGLIAMVFGRRLLTQLALGFSFLGFALFGFFPGGELVIAPLESRFPVIDTDSAEPPFGIIVLGGSVNPVHAAVKGTDMEFNDAGERVTAAAVVALQYPEAKVIVTGGHGGIFEYHAVREADAMRDILITMGVAPERIMVERNSRNTHENALRTRDLIGDDIDKPWWLITSAYHMPRSIGTFRKVGIMAIGFPVDFRRVPPFDPLFTNAFLADGLRMTDIAVREWIGSVAYWLTGKSEAVFPAPQVSQS